MIVLRVEVMVDKLTVVDALVRCNWSSPAVEESTSVTSGIRKLIIVSLVFC